MGRLLLLGGLLLGVCSTAIGADYAIPARHQTIVQEWLRDNNAFRIATLRDCDCQDNINEVRHGDAGVIRKSPTYLPYYAAGRFPGGRNFAVLVVSRGGPFVTKIVVFSEVKTIRPAVLEFPFKDEPSLISVGLFVKNGMGARDELYIGVFNSEAEALIIPPR